MEEFRCQCKKIIFQIEGDTIIVKCRHCKRFIHINTKGILNIEFKLEPETKKGPEIANVE
ncbi:hypothetical protein [Zhaonella formicivorans]|uniref:hypothetical protein n=1 Tax=Zhaonella formicivorans TaxID=2528593 RepID=UPI0010F006DD|nr:hypothetical protein [Zhaonella formicivorans]